MSPSPHSARPSICAEVVEGVGTLEAAKSCGTSGFIVNTVAFSTFVLLRFGSDPLVSLTEAISAGGDTDSIVAHRLGVARRAARRGSLADGRFRESNVFRHVFEGVVRRCMAEGLVRGEGFAIDASVVKADANRQRGVPSTENIDWSSPELGTRAVHEYLQALEQDGQVGVTPSNISLTESDGHRWTKQPLEARHFTPTRPTISSMSTPA